MPKKAAAKKDKADKPAETKEVHITLSSIVCHVHVIYLNIIEENSYYEEGWCY